MIPTAKIERLLDRFSALESEMASGASGPAFVKLSREHAELAPVIAIARAWRPSLLAGCMGASASEFWFLAFALTSAANVRTVGLVEVLFAQGIAYFFFKQATSRRESIGMTLIILGVVMLIWAH